MKPKILVVDDEPDALEVLGFKLKEAGYVPVFAKDGARALSAARDEQPALLVLTHKHGLDPAETPAPGTPAPTP